MSSERTYFYRCKKGNCKRIFLSEENAIKHFCWNIDRGKNFFEKLRERLLTYKNNVVKRTI
jgi:hypothetical protein